MSQRALAAVALAVGMLGWGAGRAAARGTLMSDQNAAGGGGGLSIGASISGGTATRILFEGAGPVLDDDPALLWTDNNVSKAVRVDTPVTSAGGQSQLLSICNSSSSSFSYADVMTINDAGNFNLLRTQGSQLAGTDPFGFGNANRNELRFYGPADNILWSQGGTLHLTWTQLNGGNATVLVSGDNNGVRLPSKNIEQIQGVATHFNKGRCTLNGGSPSQCTVTVSGSNYGGTLECVCSIVGTAHKGGCQTSVPAGGGTLTLTSDNGFTDQVSYICW